MDKEFLLQKIIQYVAYKEKTQEAYYKWVKSQTVEDEDYYHALLLRDDDKWQSLVNFIYLDEKTEKEN